jgi:aminopeptidase N
LKTAATRKTLLIYYNSALKKKLMTYFYTSSYLKPEIMVRFTRTLLLFILSFSGLYGSDNYPVNTNIDVVHYEFSVYLYDNQDIIEGEAAIRIVHRGVSNSIELDLVSKNRAGTGMTISKIEVDNKDVLWEHSDNRIVIHLSNSKGIGESSNVRVEYSGVPGDGLIISSNRFGDRTFFADNWPDRARNWIPCVDHPSDKATVDFIVYSPSHYSVVSNGYLFEESILDNNIKLTHWKEEVTISTKVMVIGVAEFATQLAGRVGNTEIWSWVFPDDRDNGFNDYSVAVEPFIFYSESIGPYAYEKLANVQSKTMFGGMENAGCVFYAERSVTGRGEAERLIAHELAHQWFGNSVTEGDWHHIWLSEGFATYFTSYYMESKYGTERLKSDMESSRARVINYYKTSPAPLIDTLIVDLMDLLSTNSYQKGAWVLHMLRSEMGDNSFIEGVRTYFSRFKNRTALSSDFFGVMEEVSGKDLSDFIEQWLYRPGIPVLSLSWSYDKRGSEITIEVEQSQEEAAFIFPLEIEIATTEGNIREVVNVKKKMEIYTFKVENKPKSVVADPDIRLLYIGKR